jgi:hypothetical protein
MAWDVSWSLWILRFDPHREREREVLVDSLGRHRVCCRHRRKRSLDPKDERRRSSRIAKVLRAVKVVFYTVCDIENIYLNIHSACNLILNDVAYFVAVGFNYLANDHVDRIILSGCGKHIAATSTKPYHDYTCVNVK